MNLHGIAGPIVAAVNPTTAVSLRISVGTSAPGPSGLRTPIYAAPGALVGSIAGNVLTASSVSLGVLQSGQTLAGAGLLPGTSIVGQIDGTPGGIGTYQVGRTQTVASEAMTTSHPARAQIQPITWRDLQQLDGLNLGGVQWKAYLTGEVDAVVRSERKGGDLVDVVEGRHQGEWLVVKILEQFANWVCAAIVLQNPT